MLMVTTMEGGNIRTREELHDALVRALNLPTWYGRNLDALYDCLTDIHEDTQLQLAHAEELFAHLGVYADVFQSVLRDACDENPHLRLNCEED